MGTNAMLFSFIRMKTEMINIQHEVTLHNCNKTLFKFKLVKSGLVIK